MNPERAAPAARIRELFRLDQRDQMFRATIESISGNLAYITRDDQSARDDQPYPTNKDVTFAPGDEVVVHRVGDTYVVAYRLQR